MSDLTEETAESVALVLQRVLEEEVDSDHVSTLEGALDRLHELYDGTFSAPSRGVTEADVERTAAFFDEYAPTREEIAAYRANNDGNHPDELFRYAVGFFDRETRYVNGVLPSYREWTVEYVDNGDVIETRTYDHDDEIPMDPVINGVRYETDRTDRGDGAVTAYVSEHPVRNDVDLVVNAEGDDFINIEAHDGPNVSTPNEPISTLAEAFDWGMLGDDEIIIRDDPENVIAFIEGEGWAYERDV